MTEKNQDRFFNVLYARKGNKINFIRFARVSSHVADFNARNKSLTVKLHQQGYRYHQLRTTFSKFYELVSKFNVGLKTLASKHIGTGIL